MSDVIQRSRPSGPADVDRVRALKLTSIAQMLKDPTRVAHRVLPGVLYGANHPYGAPGGRRSEGDREVHPRRSDRLPAALAAARQRQDLRRFRPAAERGPAAARGARSATGRRRPCAKGVKDFRRAHAAPDEPRESCWSTAPARRSRRSSARSCCRSIRTATSSPFDTANEVLGGTFLSRLNMDLRETKGWSYGVSGDASVLEHAVPYAVTAPVQADRTGDSLAELTRRSAEFLTTKGMTDEELKRYGRQQRQPAARPVRDLGRGAERDDEHGRARPARRLLRDARRRSIARRPRPRSTRRRAARSTPRASCGSWSAMRPR